MESARGPFLLVVLLVLAALAAGAEERRVAFHVTVVHVSSEPGGVEGGAAARRAHGILGERIRYESLRVLATHRRRLAVNDVGRLPLPTGRELRFRPLDVSPGGVLVAVDVEGTAQGDFRIPSGKPVVLGGHPFQKGQLVILLEPRY